MEDHQLTRGLWVSWKTSSSSGCRFSSVVVVTSTVAFWQTLGGNTIDNKEKGEATMIAACGMAWW